MSNAIFEREELANQLRAFAREQDALGNAGWTDGATRQWNALNAKYDLKGLEISKTTNRIGRDGGTLDDGPKNDVFARGNPGSMTDEDAGVAAWLCNAHGIGIPSNLFDRAMNNRCDPRASAFEVSLPTGRPSRGLQFKNSMTSGTVSGGGALVPSAFQTTLESALKLYSGMVQTSEVWITDDGRETGWPMIDDTGNVGGQMGEGIDVGNAPDMLLGQTIFRNFKLTSGVLKASHEVVRDTPLNLVEVIGEKLGERLGRILNTKCTTGVGASTFTGIVNQATVGLTAASQTAVTMDELIQLQHSVDPAQRAQPGVGWQMSDTTASYVRRLKDGEGQYLWQNSIVAGQPPMLLGFPVTLNTDLAGLTTGQKPILFGNLTKYKIRLVGKLRLRQLNERYAEYDQVGFIAFMEGDGALLVPSTTASLCPVRCIQMA